MAPTIEVLPPDGPVYFFGATPDSGAELFRSNGTAETTLPVEIVPGPSSSMPLNARVAGERFFWQGADEQHGRELWVVQTSELRFDQCRADFDGDGFITGVDFDLYVQAFEAGDMTADFDRDGFVTGVDFDLYVQAFEAGC
jgi:ELWxxDGT repeat protein